jgi:integrase
LRWRHFKDDYAEVRFPREEMKSNRPLRLPVHSELRAHLRALRVQRRRSGKGFLTDDAIIDLKPAALRRHFVSALKRIGCAKLENEDGEEESFRIHDCRHSFCSWVERRCSFASCQRLMGHAPASPRAPGAMTKRYVHLTMDELRAELEKLPWLEPRRQPHAASKKPTP